MRHFSLLVLLVLVPGEASFAYVGPGPGITLIGSLIAVAAAVVLALGGILLWPLRSLLRRRRAKMVEANQALDEVSLPDSKSVAEHQPSSELPRDI